MSSAEHTILTGPQSITVISNNEEEEEAEKESSYLPILEWTDLSYRVPPARNAPAGEWRSILDSISGQVYAGETIGIIGSSGAGKTTLLNALAGRIAGGQLSGGINYKGAPRDRNQYRRTTAYVQQDDTMHAKLTVHETLSYSAKLRLRGITDAEKAQRVSAIISKLRLDGVQDTRIGDSTTRGVSGGERKRVSIAIELLTSPNVLLLDEPTSGLDSNSSLLLVELLKELTVNSHLCTLLTVHQPSSRLFSLFDKLILLSRGKLVYFGPTNLALDYFARLGFYCPLGVNPADFLIDLVTIDHRTQALLDESTQLVEHLTLSFAMASPPASCAARKCTESDRTVHGARGSQSLQSLKRAREEPPKWNPHLYEIGVLLRREWANTVRSRAYLVSYSAQTLVLTLVIGFLYYQLGTDQVSIHNRLGLLFISVVYVSFPLIMTIIQIYVNERPIIARERSSAAYRISSYYVARTLAFIPVYYVVNTVYLLGTYVIARLSMDTSKVFVYLGSYWALIFSAICLGMAIGSAAQTIDMGLVLGPGLMTVLILFSGILSNPNSIVAGLAWVRWINPMYYTLCAVVRNEFVGLQFVCDAGNDCQVSGADVVATYGLDQLVIWVNVVATLALGCLSFGAGYVFLRWYAKPNYAWI